MREVLLRHILPISRPRITPNLLDVWGAKALVSPTAVRPKFRVRLKPLMRPDVGVTLVEPFPEPHSAAQVPLDGFPTPEIRRLFAPISMGVTVTGMHFGDMGFRSERTRMRASLGHASETGTGATRLPARPAPAMSPGFVWETIFLLLQPPIQQMLSQTVDLPSPLYDFQIEGVNFLARTTPGALLADDMGLGKTVQSIVAIRILMQSRKVSRALVVCRVSNLRQWEEEFRRWASLLRVSVCHGSFDERERRWKAPAHVYISTYDSVRNDIDPISSLDGMGYRNDFDVVVLDEISAIKNRGTKRAQAMRKLKRRVGWGLSGTPIENQLEDIYAVFEFLNPQIFGPTPFHSPAEVQKMIAPYLLRRRKSDVLTQLPPKICHDVWIELAPRQRAAYDRAYETGIIELREGQQRRQITVQHILALLGKLKQMCNVDSASEESGKLDWLQENLGEMISESKALVFSQYKDSGVHAAHARITADDFLGSDGAGVFTGDLSAAKRAGLTQRFNTDPDMRVMLLTYGAGAMGLNLQAASYVVLFDHWWNPAIMQQAEDRAHRIGQQQTVVSYRLWVRNTVEERIYQILERKRDLYDQVIDSLAVEGVHQTGLSEAELFSLFDLEPPERGRVAGPAPIHCEQLLQLSPTEFEQLVANVWEAQGFATMVTPSTGDGGIDVIAHRDDPVNPQRVAIQCKRHAHPVGRPAAQQLVGAIADEPRYTEAILVGATGFTPDCIKYAHTQGRVRLVDGERLCSLIASLDIKLF